MISVKSSTNLVRKKDFKNTLCFLWLTSHGTVPYDLRETVIKHFILRMMFKEV